MSTMYTAWSTCPGTALSGQGAVVASSLADGDWIRFRGPGRGRVESRGRLYLERSAGGCCDCAANVNIPHQLFRAGLRNGPIVELKSTRSLAAWPLCLWAEHHGHTRRVDSRTVAGHPLM